MATTGRCPSCNAPIVFAHAGSVSLVCPACDSTVVRDRDVLVNFGRTSRFDRELSAIRIGATGTWRDAPFLVAGVLRKARDRVRWNEWSIVFADGRSGWLAEGNGAFQIFAASVAVSGVDVAALGVGDTVDLDGVAWRVAEVAAAHIAASDGELPFVPDPGRDFPYADLRGDGEVGTLDGTDGTLFRGEPVELPDLGLKGLRPVTGWSDPDVVELEGPEIRGTVPMKCPACAASIPIHPAGQGVTVVCVSCGVSLAHDPVTEVLEQVKRANDMLTNLVLPLGQRGELDGAPWEVIGAVERYVRAEGVTYAWVEYLLYNPWRGFRWLVYGVDRHWSLVLPMARAPERVFAKSVKFDGEKFHRFSYGVATVGRVIGELTWECQTGDRVTTDDFVAAPRMLSRERDGSEEIWSLGTWKPASEIARAFGVSLPAPIGIAPHQPNPWDAVSWPGIVSAAAVVMLAGVLAAFVIVAYGDGVERLRGQFSSTTSQWVSAPFDVSGAGSVEIEADQLPARTVVSLVPLDGGEGVDVVPDTVFGRSHQYGWARVPAGRYVAHVETFTGQEVGQPAVLGLFGLATRDGVRSLQGMGAVALFYAVVLHPLLGPLLVWFLRGTVETERWSKADE